LGLVQDEPSEDDKVFDQEGITYVVNNDLFEKVKPSRWILLRHPEEVDFSSSPI